MTETVFKKVDYDLGGLVNDIALGRIGLPDIQRPFVWENAKVRDLFDSMYKGFPVGYLLFWENGLAKNQRAIGTEQKQLPPQLVIVDGQQRLTSLFAVIKGLPVLRKNYVSEPLRIAFNPLQDKFEVTDAAIERDKAFISDISELWSDQNDIFDIVENYLEQIDSVQTISAEERRKIRRSISNLESLLSFPFTVLQLDADISEEDVSDVFVRINSKGTPLNQADFILTLMSVFWDQGREELEKFCEESRKPTQSGPSPFNHFIEPSPDQLLRVNVGVGFKRARLRYVYSILRGKDLETEQFSDEQRVKQFNVLKKAQKRTLNLQYWHDFMSSIRLAGFRSGKMITSQNNLIFSYILYLIGKTEYHVEEFTLRKLIARWFFMSAVTGRFTGSPESAMEFDLAGFREIKKSDQFVDALHNICNIALTSDFWNVTLPNDLAKASARSPSLFGYNAALVLLDARALFSNAKMSDLLDPAVQGKRSSIERHHLFPKGYLAKLGITNTRDTNQIANYAYVEWADNTKISDQPPAEYLPSMKQRFSNSKLSKMYHYHALPENWENMEYKDFLEKRREMMAQIIHEGYQSLIADHDSETIEETFNIDSLMSVGESETLEFKSTLRVNLHTGQPDKLMELAVLKTLAGFLNTSGGTLIIGASDDGTEVGIRADNFPSEDKMSLHLVNIIKSRMGPQSMTFMNIHFEDMHNRRAMVVECRKALSATFVKDGDIERFYIRTGPSTSELSASQTQDYISQRFA